MEKEISRTSKEVAYSNIRMSIINAQSMICRACKFSEQIYKERGENERAEYGKEVLKYLSDRLTAEFGNGFDVTNF